MNNAEGVMYLRAGRIQAENADQTQIIKIRNGKTPSRVAKRVFACTD